MATLYCAEHVHIAQTRAQIPTICFWTGQESESDSVPYSVSGNANEPSVWTHPEAAIDSHEKFYLCRNLDLWPQIAATVSDDDVRPAENTRQVLQVIDCRLVQ